MPDASNRRVIVINVANRVCIAMQNVVDALDWGHRVECIYEVCSGPHEYIRGRYQIDVNGKSYPASHVWDVQMLLDLRSEADKVVRSRTEKLMQALYDDVQKGNGK